MVVHAICLVRICSAVIIRKLNLSHSPSACGGFDAITVREKVHQLLYVDSIFITRDSSHSDDDDEGKER